MSQIPDLNKLFVQDNGKVANILTSALLYGDLELLQYLLENTDNSTIELVTQPINQFLNHIQNQEIITPVDKEKLLLLSKYKIKPSIYLNHNKNYELLGYPNLYITPTLEKEINKYVITNSENRTLPPFPESLNSLIPIFLSALNEYHTNLITEEENSNNCEDLFLQQTNIEPSFKNIQEYKKLIVNEKNNQSKFIKLTLTSQTLTDLFIWELIQNPSIKELSNIKKWLLENSEKTLDDILIKGDTLLPHEQNHFASYICNKYGEDALLLTIERGWYVDFNYGSFSQCNNLVLNKDILLEITNRTPSNVYMLIRYSQYEYALDAIIEGQPTNGFNGGRDSLSLVLDRLTPFKAINFNQNIFILLEALLANTTLTKKHFSRLSRLQLKYPNYYENLIQKFPNIEVAGAFKPNSYISFL
jgi:hypothetical protein